MRAQAIQVRVGSAPAAAVQMPLPLELPRGSKGAAALLPLCRLAVRSVRLSVRAELLLCFRVCRSCAGLHVEMSVASSRSLLALRDGAGHARCGCHRHAARRRELVDVVPRRVPPLSVDVLTDIVLHILLGLHILLAAHALMDILLHCREAAWLMLSSFCSTEISTSGHSSAPRSSAASIASCSRPGLS